MALLRGAFAVGARKSRTSSAVRAGAHIRMAPRDVDQRRRLVGDGHRRHRAGREWRLCRTISLLHNGNVECLAVIAGNRVRNATFVTGARTHGHRCRRAGRLKHVCVLHALLRAEPSGLATRTIGIDAKAVRENAHGIYDGSTLNVGHSQVGGPVRRGWSLVRQREDEHDEMEAFGGRLASAPRGRLIAELRSSAHADVVHIFTYGIHIWRRGFQIWRRRGGRI